jgi:hypothetical protein
MALPRLTEAEIKTLIEQAGRYAEGQRQRFLARAKPLDPSQNEAMRPFFSSQVLEDARMAVLENEALHNPSFIAELRARGFESLFDMNHLNAASFLDLLVFHGQVTKRLLFHGLVHTVQQRTLGFERWLEFYVRSVLKTGLRVAIPLEVQAYELDGRFVLTPASAFSVEDEVSSWAVSGRYAGE